MSVYRADDSEDSFEDFLEWRRWKRETARGGGEAVVSAPASRSVAVPKQVTAAAAAAPPANKPVSLGASSKGKEEASSKAVVAVPKADTTSYTSGNIAGAVSVPRAGEAAQDKESVATQNAGEKWVAEFNAANDKQKKALRNAVTAETKTVLDQGSYRTLDSGTVVEVDVVGASAGRVVYTGEESFPKPPASFNTTAHFVKSDAIDTALFLIEKKGVNPLIVVPVDPKNIGEGFPGSSSLEEQAYRRSTLWAAVDGAAKSGDFNYSVPEKGCIYLPSVQVFRDCESKSGYQYFKAPRKLAFALASSVAKPKWEQKGKNVVLEADAKAAYIAKFRTLLNVGIAKGHDAIVLTAFGCGYNQTPPQAVGGIIRDLITTEFAQTYKHITFAIIEDENCGLPHNINGNLMPFQSEFLLMEKGASGGCCKK